MAPGGEHAAHSLQTDVDPYPVTDPAYHFDADSDYQNEADADPDPQHSPREHEQTKYLVSLPTSGAESNIVPAGEASIWLQLENTQHALRVRVQASPHAPNAAQNNSR